MRWTHEAEEAVKRVPFFVRKKVRRRIEEDAKQTGRPKVTLGDVKMSRKQFLSNMAREVKGYQLENCFSDGGCPNRAMDAGPLMEKLERLLREADLLTFLKRKHGDDLKFHHEFRITVAECPNACSRPQIKAVGIIGARRPVITKAPCSGCGACAEICPDNAVVMDTDGTIQKIDEALCMVCGKCINVCPDGTIEEAERGYKILTGGKLGRHPRLGRQLPDLFDEDGVVRMVSRYIDEFKSREVNRR